MKLLRKKAMQKGISIFFLLLFLQSTFLSKNALALTGPNMPEYSSYEAPGVIDMVDLSTGDFSFRVPSIDIPGPEGSYSLPISYHAGIGLDQEASWVGLGWTLNAGSISRTIEGFPDDSNGEGQVVTVQDLTGLEGWDATIPGLGGFGYNNMEGHNGHYSILSILNGSWDNKGYEHDVIGIRYTGKKGDFMDVGKTVMGFLTIVSLGMAAEAAAAKAAHAATASNYSFFNDVLKDAFLTQVKADAIYAGKQFVVDNLHNTGLGSTAESILGKSNAPQAPTSGYWKYSEDKHNYFFYKDYKIWLDQSRFEMMYGTMYLGNAATQNYTGTPAVNLNVNGSVISAVSRYISNNQSNQGAASDVNYPPMSSGNDFETLNKPALLATDNFRVNAPGISGNIKPYRLDIGAVSVPRQVSESHERLALVPFVTNDALYKVPFIYDGQIAGGYFNHVGKPYAANAVVTSPGTIGAPQVNLGITQAIVSDKININLSDVVFSDNQRIRNVPESPELQTSKKIAQDKYIEWLTNDEIRATKTYPSKFMDFLSDETPTNKSYRKWFRTPKTPVISETTSNDFSQSFIPIDPLLIPIIKDAKVLLTMTSFANTTDMNNGTPVRMTKDVTTVVNSVNVTNSTVAVSNSDLYQFEHFPAKIKLTIVSSAITDLNGWGTPSGLGGFCITGTNGNTYHFALPLYEYDQYTEVAQAADHNKKSFIQRSKPFAYNWLLTAITSPDFLDKNANGMVDDGDWGGWVKFNYGYQANNAEWRTPYEENTYSALPDPQFESYAKGKKQVVFLNSIETRSHVALFLKSPREDGKSAGANPIKPLRLDEIVLLTKEKYKKLVSTYSIPDYSAFFADLCLSSQFAENTPVRQFIDLNTVKRVKFTYDYTLCDKTLNSSSGKLTLKRVSYYGKNNKKLIPDYKFEYANNPDYHKDKWDGYGLYASSATRTSHEVSQTSGDVDGAAWSLTKVTSPMGSTLQIAYERDQYFTIAGNMVRQTDFGFNNTGTTLVNPQHFPIKTLNVNHGGALKPNDYVSFLGGGATFSCPSGGTGNYNFSGTYKITAVTPTSITLDREYMSVVPSCGPPSTGSYYTFSYYNGTIMKAYNGKRGDGLRVASLTSNDSFNESPIKIRYIYDSEDGVNGSGGIAQEPTYIGTSVVPNGFPFTPVIYGRVTVLTGPLSTDADYYSKEVYEFETPLSSHYTVDSKPAVTVVNGLLKTTLLDNRIQDFSNRIGSLKSMKVYDKNNVLQGSTQMEYTSDQILNDGVNKNQGVYTEGTLMFDKLMSFNLGIPRYTFKTTRTTSIQYPRALKKVTRVKDGFTTVEENTGWDYYSGRVVEKLSRNAVGITLKTVIKPAYTAYPELGPRALNINNRNLLAYDAAQYVYKLDALGDVSGLVNGQVLLWKKDWNYRDYNSSTGDYVPTLETSVWRSGASYTWLGDEGRLQPDGTQRFSSSDEFNFLITDPNNYPSTWKKTKESVLYDHFGATLQSADINNIHTTVKLGYDDKIVVAQALNARYDEVAFSSAEDKIAGINYFGGEVSLGSGTVIRGNAHTGDCALSIPSGQYGFTYKVISPNKTLQPYRTYRVMAWCNSTNGRIYYKLNGQTIQLSAAPTKQGKTGWYRLSVDISIPQTFLSLEVGVKANSGTVVFDDFRFQPSDAVMTAYVIPPLDYEYPAGVGFSLYELNNDNYYLRMETSEDGLSEKTYQESSAFNGETLLSEQKANYRRFNIDQ